MLQLSQLLLFLFLALILLFSFRLLASFPSIHHPSHPSSLPRTLLSLPLRILRAIWTMLIAPLVQRPFPVNVAVDSPDAPGPSTLIDRSIDSPPTLKRPESPWPVNQPYDAFLVLDVEATCQEGTDFTWPNEIIVRPSSLLFSASLTLTQPSRHTRNGPSSYYVGETRTLRAGQKSSTSPVSLPSQAPPLIANPSSKQTNSEAS